ncbi:MAG: acyl-CoA dehydrogenase family protein [Nocardioides sp.]|uniref:acyl-CoA dehydrogenase family protein n=1 Tax=Nocardioides sp. TaxID=35761 RepID=UPI0039E49AD5
MHFALTPEQRELVSTVRALVERRVGSVDLRTAYGSEPGYDAELWQVLCEQIGVAALAVPEEYGGAGFSSLETHLVLEELGASLTPSPLLGSGVLATQALLLSGPEALAGPAGELLPELTAGSVAALCWADAGGRWRTDGSDLTATPEEGRWRLRGTATLVLGASHADVLLAVARTPSGVGLFQLPAGAAGVEVRRTPGLDLTLSLADVTLDALAAPLVESGFEAVLPRLRALAATAVTALQVGGAQRALDLTVAYLKERVQFGRPLGSFQALKHRCADLVVAVESARSISWAAGWSAAYDSDTLEHRAALAKSWCGDAFAAVAGEMIQLHGGIAITWEHDAHLYFKRAHATGQLFGRGAEHRRGLSPAGDHRAE